MLVDTAQYPGVMSLSHALDQHDTSVVLTSNARPVELSDCRVAWWRRPLPHRLDDALDPAVVSFAYQECHEAFMGALASLDVTWVNPPELDERAHHKPLQLAAASRVGLTIPRTLITNDPDEARCFITRIGPSQTVYKTFLATESHWRETRVLHDDELPLLESVRLAPVIFQEFVPAVADVRVTVVGDTFFTTAITAPPSGYKVDYRMDMAGAHFAPATLDDEVGRRLHALMRELGLVYGAADFRLTPDGQYVFLEVNPAGEWRFIEERTQQAITAAMAALLIQLDATS